MKLSAGIQSLPPQYTGILLTWKKKLVPGWSFRGRWMSSALRRPSFLVHVATSSLPLRRGAFTAYSGCFPYRTGYHSEGLLMWKVADVPPALTSTVSDATELPPSETSNRIFPAPPSTVAFATTVADLSDSSTVMSNHKSEMRDSNISRLIGLQGPHVRRVGPQSLP